MWSRQLSCIGAEELVPFISRWYQVRKGVDKVFSPDCIIMYGAGAASVVTVYAGSSSAHVCPGPAGISVIVAKLRLLS